MTQTQTDSYAYCDLDHPSGDAEARDWCRRYHQPSAPRLTEQAWEAIDTLLACEPCSTHRHEYCRDRTEPVTLPSSTMLGCQPTASYCCCAKQRGMAPDTRVLIDAWRTLNETSRPLTEQELNWMRWLSAAIYREDLTAAQIVAGVK